MSRKILVVLLVSIFLLSFTCAFAGAEGKKAKITFMTAIYSEATAPFWNEVIEAFEKKYPNVEVVLDLVPWENVYQKTTTLISAKQEPDILNTDQIHIQYAAEGLLEPLDGYIDEDFKSIFIPAMLKSGFYEGKTVSLPLLASVRGLYYNEDVLKKANVKPPMNWDELVEVCLAINNPPELYAFGMPITNFEGFAYISYFLWAAGGQWFDESGRCAVNNEAGVRALTFASDLVNKYKVVYPGWSTVNRDETQKVMTAEKIGMMMSANFFYVIAKDENPNLHMNVVPIPADREQYNLGIVDCLCMFKRSEHKKEAFDFIKFYYEGKWHKQFIKMEGMLPVTKEVSKDIESDPDLGRFVKMLPHARFLPLHPLWEPVALEVTKAWQLAILGEKTPKVALDDAVEIINRDILKK